MHNKPETKQQKAIYGTPDSRFELIHDLMPKKVTQILLVASTYDAWMMEVDVRLSERIINEYRGLNLSSPPRLHWVSSYDEALEAIDRKNFDLVIVMAGDLDIWVLELGHSLKSLCPQMPRTLLCHNSSSCNEENLGNKFTGYNQVFYWSGNTDLLVALIKRVEDRQNIIHDIRHARVRVILVVEDSPLYLSSLLPILYRELVMQVQSVMEEGLNEEHRQLAMRTRPKILVAGSYEEALSYFEQIEPFILGVISDMRYPRGGQLDDRAGMELLKKIHTRCFDIPLLLISSEPSNATCAAEIPASFISKHSPTLSADIHEFFIKNLGFGPFVFKTPDGSAISRATSMLSLEKQIGAIDQDVFAHHCNRNDFSRWFFARAEIGLAEKVRPINRNSFPTIEERRSNLLSMIRDCRRQRQKGLVVNFNTGTMDMDTDFFRIGNGSLGGKARGLAFISSLLNRDTTIADNYPSLRVSIPQTLVITTEGFDDFIEMNHLKPFSKSPEPDTFIADRFLKARLPGWVVEKIEAYLHQVVYPLAVRSSGLLEDAQSRAYAGLYHTYMLPNNHPDVQVRMSQLCQAIKLVYASTYFENPKRFARRIGHRIEEEKMAVIVQQLIGQTQDGYHYPAVSGVAQSINYYPFSKMKPEEGIVSMVAGLGKTVMQGGQALRFSPHHPHLNVQGNDAEDILKNAQTSFYALNLESGAIKLGINEDITLKKRQVSEAINEPAIQMLCGTYLPEERRIRDTHHHQGYPVLTFANILKYNHLPLAELLKDLLFMGQKAMDRPVEIEFSVNLGQNSLSQPDVAVLQIRPMAAQEEQMHVEISPGDVKKAFCFSAQALGNTHNCEITDIVYVKPDTFDPAHTVEMAGEIHRINARLQKENRKYLLVGPGRWGSADRWLGIPVRWSDISAVGAVIETELPQLNAEPSQGSHFFHNLVSLGIAYLNVLTNSGDFLHWHQLTRLPAAGDYRHTTHVQLNRPVTLKVDGRNSRAVVLLHQS